MSLYKRFQSYAAKKIKLIKQYLFRQRRPLQLKCSTDHSKIIPAIQNTSLLCKTELTMSEQAVTNLPEYDAHQSFTNLDNNNEVRSS